VDASSDNAGDVRLLQQTYRMNSDTAARDEWSISRVGDEPKHQPAGHYRFTDTTFEVLPAAAGSWPMPESVDDHTGFGGSYTRRLFPRDS
jgi:hypothetical protein